MRQEIPFVLQFINTSSDIKDYYVLSSRKTDTSEILFQLRHYVPTDDGVYLPERYLNFEEKIIEAPKAEISDIRFLENSIAKSSHKVHVFHGPEFNFDGRYTRFHFHGPHDRVPPKNEANKFVGVYIYSPSQEDKPDKPYTHKLLLFRKNSNSVQSYEQIGEFDDLEDEKSLAYKYIEQFESNGNRVDVYYYGKHEPTNLRLENLKTMTLSVQVMQSEVCLNHTNYERSCIECIKADILSAPRHLLQLPRRQGNIRKTNKNHCNVNPRRRRRNY